jgi:Tol biopolymer transport system component
MPFWSPDSRYLGFFADGKLKKVDISGGPPLVLSDAPDSLIRGGGAWNRDGVILFSGPGGLFQVSASGGEAKPVTKIDESRGEAAHNLPHFLPDGKHFLYLVRSGKPEVAGIYLGSLVPSAAEGLDSSEPVRLLNADAKAEYAQGHVLYLRARTLLAQPFDPDRLRLTGEPVPVADQVGFAPNRGSAAFSVSENGTLVFGPAGAGQTTRLQWFDRGGTRLEAVGPPATYTDPELSPDGKRVAVERTDPQTGSGDIWLLETARDVASRFTFEPTNDANANWSPDGSQIIFRSRQQDLYRKASSGVQKEEVLLQSSVAKYPLDWSADGRFLVYDAVATGGLDLWVLPLEGDKKPFPFFETQFNEGHAQFSPDGRRLAYISNESGRYEVYIQSFPKAGGKWQVSTGGGLQPRWRRDGKELYYIAPDQKLMAVPIRGETGRGDSALEVSQPLALFQTQMFEAGAFVLSDRQQYDVTADGQRFLINTPVEGSASAPLTVVLNWPAR